jgi:co-chaperonin GroES (HSP10)
MKIRPLHDRVIVKRIEDERKSAVSIFWRMPSR